MTPTEETEDNEFEFTEAVIRNAFDLLFEPEIERRQFAGSLPKPFSLWAAQAILEVGKPPRIYFNDEIRGVFQASLGPDAKLPIEKGAVLRKADLAEIQGMQLTAEEANAGHLTAVVHGGRWCLMFDFRYNAARIARYAEVAKEFFAAAEKSLTDNNLHAAIENLFASVELTAKSYLMVHPDTRLLEKTRHAFIATEFNRYGGKHGNVDAAFVELFNTLGNSRTKARYPDEPLTVTTEDVTGWLATAKAMLEDLDARRPRTRPTDPQQPDPSAGP